MTQPILAIVGPTCVGKTTVAVASAQRLPGTELVNADSRQVRTGALVATFAPTSAELHGVPCHLLGLVPPGVPFNVADWLAEATTALTDLEARGGRAILVGGTGLFVKALVDGFDFGKVPPDPTTREERTAEAATDDGLRGLAAELTARDPQGAKRTDLRNPRRVLRALEILDARPGPLIETRGATPRWEVVQVGLDVAADAHRTLVQRRVEDIFHSGAVLDEVAALLEAGVGADDLAACGIGYQEALDVLRGARDVDAAIAATVGRTLRYAKAQRTWFRRDPRVHWLRSDLLSVDELAAQAASLADCIALGPAT
ncbi:MAG TPA: tRNA (adenosine(37)-N6)-dimethylallyltransferase MiaA [Candidatus Acidoferrales bacterium]|nr:tRNA (adenosine(37)-N6)-dimethylallyltransferase MiaA [Candidatus Acidoferrales bacterium]